MEKITDTRRKNLLKFIEENHEGNRAEFCRAVGKNPNLINLVLTRNSEYQKNIGEKLARDLEELAGMPNGWLDRKDNTPHTETESVLIKTTDKDLSNNLWLTMSKSTKKKLSTKKPMVLMLVIQHGKDGVEAVATHIKTATA